VLILFARHLKVVNYFSKSSTNGVFSQFNSKLKAGDVLEVGTPEGKFTFA
jgi:chemotaxis methyl-accepting protein methylase